MTDEKETIAALKNKYEILFGFMELLPDHLHAAIQLINGKRYGDAVEKLQSVQLSALNTLKEAVSVEKLPY